MVIGPGAGRNSNLATACKPGADEARFWTPPACQRVLGLQQNLNHQRGGGVSHSLASIAASADHGARGRKGYARFARRFAALTPAAHVVRETMGDGRTGASDGAPGTRFGGPCGIVCNCVRTQFSKRLRQGNQGPLRRPPRSRLSSTHFHQRDKVQLTTLSRSLRHGCSRRPTSFRVPSRRKWR